MIRLLIADGSPYLRENLSVLLSSQESIAVVAVAANGGEVLEQVTRLGPDLVLLDAQLPGLDGVAATAAIKGSWPAVGVLLFGVFADHLQAGARAGADGCLLKDCSLAELVQAIRAIYSRLRQKQQPPSGRP